MNAHPDAKLTVFAIWLPMLSDDSRAGWNERVLDDPRVVSLWDGDRIAGAWFASHQVGGLGEAGGIVWDAYFAFGQDSTWSSEPTGLLAAGSEIIGNTEGLEQRFLPLLRRS